MSRDAVATVICISGATLITFGLWLAWAPLAPLFGGAMLLGFGIFVHRLPVKTKRGEV